MLLVIPVVSLQENRHGNKEPDTSLALSSSSSVAIPTGAVGRPIGESKNALTQLALYRKVHSRRSLRVGAGELCQPSVALLLAL